ncbi:hypothetical protein [Bordetella sp. LUAb4]|uniref:hypothetical protein n=1 Tax=Bordetella sp. LUAb4 TaxID=2843195 RepID=UPI001E65325C|nr:hypothetical protein [Bordetella sp. LUAb4]
MRKYEILHTGLEASFGAVLKKNVFTGLIYVLEKQSTIAGPTKFERLVINEKGRKIYAKTTSFSDPPMDFCIDDRDWLYLLNFPAMDTNQLRILTPDLKWDSTITFSPGLGTVSMSYDPRSKRVYVPGYSADTPPGVPPGTAKNVLNIIDTLSHEQLPEQPPLNAPNALDKGSMAFDYQVMDSAKEILYLCDRDGTVLRFDTKALKQIDPPMYVVPPFADSLVVHELTQELYLLNKLAGANPTAFIRRLDAQPPFMSKAFVEVPPEIQLLLIDDRYVYGVSPEGIMLYTLGNLELAGIIPVVNGTPLGEPPRNPVVEAIHDKVGKQIHLLLTYFDNAILQTVRFLD